MNGAGAMFKSHPNRCAFFKKSINPKNEFRYLDFAFVTHRRGGVNNGECGERTDEFVSTRGIQACDHRCTSSDCARFLDFQCSNPQPHFIHDDTGNTAGRFDC